MIGGALDVGPLAYVALILFYGSFAPAIQLPFRYTAAVALLIVTVGIWCWAQQAGASWELEQATLLLTAGISALLIGPTVAWTQRRKVTVCFSDVVGFTTLADRVEDPGDIHRHRSADNIAARVQAESRPGGILLSNISWHLVKGTVACEPRGEVMVKRVHFPIELYEPQGR